MHVPKLLRKSYRPPHPKRRQAASPQACETASSSIWMSFWFWGLPSLSWTGVFQGMQQPVVWRSVS